MGSRAGCRAARRGRAGAAGPRRAAGRGRGSVRAGAGGGGEACKAGGCTGGGSSSAGAGRFLPGSEVALAAGCCDAAAVYVKPSVAGRDRNNNNVIDAQNTPKARRKVILCDR